MLRNLARTVERLTADLQRAAQRAEDLESDTEANAEEAQEHGWDGVAWNNQQAGQALDVLIEVIGTARRTASEALGSLRPEPAGSGVSPVAGRLRNAVEHLTLLGHAVDAAVPPCEEAARSAQIAGMNHLAGDLERLYAELTDAAATLDQTLARAEAELEAPGTAGRSLVLAWEGEATAVAHSPEDLAETLSRAQATARGSGLAQTICVRADGLPGPSLEVGLAHPVRADVRWLAKGVQEQASDPDLAPLEDQPAATLDDAQYILEVFLRDGTRAEGYEWTDSGEPTG